MGGPSGSRGTPMLVRALPYLITATLLVVLATVVGVAWALSHALVYYQALSAFAAASRGTSVGALFEHRLPRSALLAVHDVYAGVVGNIARHHLIDASTGHMVRSGWDVSTHLEFTLIWSRMVAQGYLHNTSSPALSGFSTLSPNLYSRGTTQGCFTYLTLRLLTDKP